MRLRFQCESCNRKLLVKWENESDFPKKGDIAEFNCPICGDLRPAEYLGSMTTERTKDASAEIVVDVEDL